MVCALTNVVVLLCMVFVWCFVWLQVEAAHRPAQWRQASRLCSHPAICRKVTSERHAHCHQVCGHVPASLFSFLLHSIPPLPLSGTRKQNVMILCSSQTDWVVSSWSLHSHYYHSRLLLLHQTPHSHSLTFSLLLPCFHFIGSSRGYPTGTQVYWQKIHWKGENDLHSAICVSISPLLSSPLLQLCGVSILRAGEVLEPALASVCKDPTVGKILIQTNETTGEPEVTQE